MTACAPGAEARWPALYAKARSEGECSVRTDAFDAMATGEWELVPGVWQDTELLLWKPPVAWFSINAFFATDGSGAQRLRNWYVNFEHPAGRTANGFDTFELTVDLVIDPDLSTLTWKDEDEYAHVQRLGIVTDTEHQAVDDARAQVLAMLAERHAWRSADPSDVTDLDLSGVRHVPDPAPPSNASRISLTTTPYRIPHTPV